MNLLSADPAPWASLLAAAPALALLLGAVLASPHQPVRAWRIASGAAAAAGVSAAATLLAWWLAGPHHGALWRVDAPSAWIGAVVAFIGWVVVRHARTALDGEPASAAAVRPLLAALAGGAGVVASNHLLLLAAAWLLTSLSLHRLLLFFPERPAARVAAHKKFMAARVADGCMLAACALLYAAFGTLQIDHLATAASAPGGLPWAAQAAVAAVAGVVLAAVLKCAQLPFHGWLIQVMEAPTPFSALLHAGVVNLGGVVLVKLSPLLAQVPLAMVALVVVGSFTAVVAALVMSTRISIKVALAWSTCAQMGFMLLQCGLGLWEMALLHLAGHSLYKAHAFLSAGGTVQGSIVRRLSPPAGPASLASWALAVAAAALMVWGCAAWLLPMLQGGAAVSPLAATSPAAWVMAAVLAGALAPLLLSRRAGAQGATPWEGALKTGVAAALAAALVLWYFLLHHLLEGSAGTPASPPGVAVALAGTAFALLFATQAVLQARPQGALARRLYPVFYGGLYLDDLVSRPLLRLWPVPSPAAATPPIAPQTL